jgi:hypothetical protein
VCEAEPRLHAQKLNPAIITVKLIAAAAAFRAKPLKRLTTDLHECLRQVFEVMFFDFPRRDLFSDTAFYLQNASHV